MMELRATRGPRETLRRLPTSAHPIVDGADVVVPESYMEAMRVGLSLPTGIIFADDGALFVLEGGSTWPTRPYLPACILRLNPSDRLEEVAVEVLGGPRGVAYAPAPSRSASKAATTSTSPAWTSRQVIGRSPSTGC